MRMFLVFILFVSLYGLLGFILTGELLPFILAGIAFGLYFYVLHRAMMMP